MTARVFTALAVPALAGCLAAPSGSMAAVEVRRVEDAPTWGMVVDASGEASAAQLKRREAAVIVSAPDRATAIAAMVRFCAARGVTVSSNWDTDFVYRDPDGAWWFSGVC